mgnify:CR=1 FL=1
MPTTSLEKYTHLKAHNNKNKRRKNVLRTAGLVLGMILFISNSAFAQSENNKDRKKPPTFEQLLEKMDANEDGKLSQKEVKGPLKDHFAEVDGNEDGFITEEELKKAPRPKGKGKSNND